MIPAIRRFACCAIFAAAFLVAGPFPPAENSGTMTSHHAAADFPLTADPDSPNWRVSGVVTDIDRFGKPIPGARTEIRSRWTSDSVYFLFVSNFLSAYSRPNPTPGKETWGLWEYDVAEVFIGSDLKNIHLYKEFEVSPDSEFIDLDVDRKRAGKEVDWLWNSGFQYKNNVDHAKHVWTCEIRIPWKSIDTRTPVIGNQFRLNLYRIEGGPKDRKYIVWQRLDNPSYHTPERFGRLVLGK